MDGFSFLGMDSVGEVQVVQAVAHHPAATPFIVDMLRHESDATCLRQIAAIKRDERVENANHSFLVLRNERWKGETGRLATAPSRAPPPSRALAGSHCVAFIQQRTH